MRPTEPKPGTQNAAILAYIRERGSITPMEALEHCGCMRLAARVQELEEMGWTFDAELAHENGKTFARYSLHVSEVDLESLGQLRMFV